MVSARATSALWYMSALPSSPRGRSGCSRTTTSADSPPVESGAELCHWQAGRGRQSARCSAPLQEASRSADIGTDRRHAVEGPVKLRGAVGFAKRVVRKSVRKATPRSVRKAMNPVGTVKSAITPRPVKQLTRGVYTVTNPLGAAENALIGSVLNAGGGRRRSR